MGGFNLKKSFSDSGLLVSLIMLSLQRDLNNIGQNESFVVQLL